MPVSRCKSLQEFPVFWFIVRNSRAGRNDNGLLWKLFALDGRQIPARLFNMNNLEEV